MYGRYVNSVFLLCLQQEKGVYCYLDSFSAMIFLSQADTEIPSKANTDLSFANCSLSITSVVRLTMY